MLSHFFMLVRSFFERYVMQTTGLVTFTEEILNEKLHFLCSVDEIGEKKFSFAKYFLFRCFHNLLKFDYPKFYSQGRTNFRYKIVYVSL